MPPAGTTKEAPLVWPRELQAEEHPLVIELASETVDDLLRRMMPSNHHRLALEESTAESLSRQGKPRDAEDVL